MENKINYTLKKSRKAKSLRLAVYCDSRVVVTTPDFFSLNKIEDFITKKEKWILEKINHFSKFEKYNLPKISKKEFPIYKKQALILVKNRL